MNAEAEDPRALRVRLRTLKRTQRRLRAAAFAMLLFDLAGLTAWWLTGGL